MKQAQNPRKQRGKTPIRKGGKSNGGPGNRNNEPKVRGNPKQLLEKYKNQAREAKQAGDRVQAEYYYQFADHYQRVLNDMMARSGVQIRDDRDDAEDVSDEDEIEQEDSGNQQRRGRGRRQGRGNRQEQPSAGGDDAASVDMSDAEQPVEVHPELDLDGTAVEGEEKPRRRRAPAQRRRGPRKAADENSAPDAAPEGNEAA